MNNKNWGDKADKDLFFTILSVKNIGVISGAEWTTIGNHMRSMGYGFTNEGCRQHFQGLRRAQQKAEANGVLGEHPRKIDPTLNPITRRPGPGRGRPRKSTSGIPGIPGSSPQDTELIDPTQSQQQSPDPHQIPQSMPPQIPMDPNVGPAPTPMMDAAPPEMQAPPPQETVVMQTDGVEGVGGVEGVEGVESVGGVEGVEGVEGVDGVAEVEVVEGVSFDETSEEPEEHAAKRAKLEENHDPALNDEAILSALAAHNNPAEDYNTDFYGEA